VDEYEDTDPSTRTLTFSLVASAQLALADGDARRAAVALGTADWLTQRAGLRTWPSTRRAEKELIGRVSQEAGPRDFEDAFAAGSELSHRQAVAVVRGDSSREGGRDRGGPVTE
jgi:hypothetical protein